MCSVFGCRTACSIRRTYGIYHWKRICEDALTVRCLSWCFLKCSWGKIEANLGCYFVLLYYKARNLHRNSLIRIYHKNFIEFSHWSTLTVWHRVWNFNAANNNAHHRAWCLMPSFYSSIHHVFSHPGGRFNREFLTKFMYAFLVSPYCPDHYNLLNINVFKIVGNVTLKSSTYYFLTFGICHRLCFVIYRGLIHTSVHKIAE